MARRSGQIPWWLLATAVVLTAALVISATAGRVVEAIVIAVLLALTLAVVLLWLGSRSGWFGGEAS